MTFKRFGYKTNLGFEYPSAKVFWRMPDPVVALEQFYLLDPTDREDILYPNRVTRSTYPEMRRRYAGNELGRKLYFDIWLTDYFKVYRDGAYMDRLPDPRKVVLESTTEEYTVPEEVAEPEEEPLLLHDDL